MIQTEFGKVIGGYTPLMLSKVENEQFGADPSKRSFIFSLTLRQKMKLIDSERAVVKGKSEGPIFGSGHDIFISDYCNDGRKSYAKLPESYHFDLTGQEAWSEFCGNKEGYDFKVR